LLLLVLIVSAILDSLGTNKTVQESLYPYYTWHLRTGRIPAFKVAQVPATPGFKETTTLDWQAIVEETSSGQKLVDQGATHVSQPKIPSLKTMG
jgi:hypothetical protein